MHTTRFERTVLAKFFVAGWVAFFCVAIEHAQAQLVNPPPPPPPPVFNPSTPYTVPQSPETPVSPGMPRTLPGSEALPPQDGSLPSAAARSHRRAVTSATMTSNVAKARGERHSPRHHPSRGSHGAAVAIVGTMAAPYYYPLLDWSNGPYPSCVWRREWGGYWARICM